MTKTEGEKEIVLGNRQLLGIFFVVAALLGVFFSLGYIIGRNTLQPTAAAATSIPSTQTPATSAAQPRPDAQVQSYPPSVSAPGSVVDNPADGGSTARVESRPDPGVQPGAVSAPRTGTEAPSAKPEPTPVTGAEKASATDAAQPSDMFLQLMAVKKPDADNTVKLLRDRGFAATAKESSKEGLFRVLVGPFADNTSLAKAKSSLKEKGFESIVVHEGR